MSIDIGPFSTVPKMQNMNIIENNIIDGAV